MKKVILFFALFVCISVFAQSDLEQLQLQYEQAEEQYQDLYTENSTLIKDLKERQNQLLEEIRLKEEEIETAKSIKAKKLNKQIENLSAKVAQFEYQIENYENEIEKVQARKDSLKLEINKQQENNRIEASVEENVDENENVELIVDVESRESLEQGGKLYVQDISDESKEENNASSKSSEEDDDPVGTILFAIGVIVLLVIIGLIKRERCPYCGKKGTLSSLGDTRKYQYDEKGNVTRTGVLKRYKCKHCGNYVEKLKWS